MPFRTFAVPVLLAATAFAVVVPAPASAEVFETRADGFIVRYEITVPQPKLAVWLALTKPGDWWSSEHSWSGNAKNMSLTPQGGGCWCERVPGEGKDAGEFEGSARHGTVLMSAPLRLLRLEAALGPLQSEPARGILTYALKDSADGGTTVQLEYNVGGSMRYKPAELAKMVDRVLGEQMKLLAAHLGGKVAAKGADTSEAAAAEAGGVESDIDALADQE